MNDLEQRILNFLARRDYVPLTADNLRRLLRLADDQERLFTGVLRDSVGPGPTAVDDLIRVLRDGGRRTSPEPVDGAANRSQPLRSEANSNVIGGWLRSLLSGGLRASS